MITPYDIESKEFAKAVRGYNIEDVDAFLDEITIDLEKLMCACHHWLQLAVGYLIFVN